MKKPFLKWLMISATVITPTTPAAATGLSNPTMSIAPAPSSVRLASHAWNVPGFMPRLANQRPVPSILPPPQMWL